MVFSVLYVDSKSLHFETIISTQFNKTVLNDGVLWHFYGIRQVTSVLLRTNGSKAHLSSELLFLLQHLRSWYITAEILNLGVTAELPGLIYGIQLLSNVISF